MSIQKEKAKKFHNLHHEDGVFILPNAWDVISAKVFEECGFEAIGTTSAGVAIAKGYPDGEKIPVQEMIQAIQEISSAVKAPVSADIEAGYGKTVEEVVAVVEQVIEAGAIGINLEDGSGDEKEPLLPLDEQIEKITAIQKLAEEKDVPLFINARTDTYWLSVGDEQYRLDETLKRIKAFEEAGSHCVFVPGLYDAEIIQRLREEVACPINLLVSADLPSIEKLAEIGIERVSCGSAPFRAAVTLIQTMGDEMMQEKTFKHSTEGVRSYDDVIKLV